MREAAQLSQWLAVDAALQVLKRQAAQAPAGGDAAGGVLFYPGVRGEGACLWYWAGMWLRPNRNASCQQQRSSSTMAAAARQASGSARAPQHGDCAEGRAGAEQVVAVHEGQLCSRGVLEAIQTSACGTGGAPEAHAHGVSTAQQAAALPPHPQPAAHPPCRWPSMPSRMPSVPRLKVCLVASATNSPSSA